MNRREFVGFAALAPLVASAADLKSARADRPFILLPDSARVCDIGVKKRYLSVLKDIVSVVECLFWSWSRGNSTLRKLCAIT